MQNVNTVKTAYFLGNAAHRYEQLDRPWPVNTLEKNFFPTRDAAVRALGASQRVKTGRLDGFMTDIYTVSGTFEWYGELLRAPQTSGVVIQNCDYDIAPNPADAHIDIYDPRNLIKVAHAVGKNIIRGLICVQNALGGK